MHRDRLLYAGEYLEANLFEPLTMEDIASASAMSLRSLQRHFVGAVGESLASYVRGTNEGWLQGEACQQNKGEAKGPWEIRHMKPWKRS